MDYGPGRPFLFGDSAICQELDVGGSGPARTRTGDINIPSAVHILHCKAVWTLAIRRLICYFSTDTIRIVRSSGDSEAQVVLSYLLFLLLQYGLGKKTKVRVRR